DVISADSVDDSKDKSEPTTSSDVADSGDEAHTASAENGGDETRAEDAPEQESTSDQDTSDKETSAKDASTDTDDDKDEGPSFDDLDLSEDVVRAVKKVGFETPSPIQAATIPILAQGRDVVGLAQTGTGKTAAFALPILSRLDRSQKKPQALVLSPTRELALQVADAFQEFADHLGGVHVLPIYGGQSYGIQLSG
ncbi:DEAD/DEAH box helicase, partial [Klebsiella pneumoniae]|uniref:DEAD/DEAH box helicase n=2 Tax=Bacteria TaxID=2 RepID=UPI00197AA674